jgi:hypothetical protein
MIEVELVVGGIILIICAYLIAVFGGALFVGLFLKFLKMPQIQNSSEGLPGAGTLVGILERAIILTFGLLGEYGAISFVFVAKSMARFKQLENRQFAEYYLIGTLLSFFFALIVAVAAQSLFILFILPLNQ